MEVSQSTAQRSQELQYLTILEVKSRSILDAASYLQVLSGALDNALAESESTLLSSRGVWEHLQVLRSTGEVAQSVWEDCMLLPDRFTFCWCHIWVIKVTIPIKPIFGIGNAFGCAIPITFNRMSVYFLDSAYIEYLSSPSKEVFGRHSWWLMWSFRQCKCSCTIRLNIWPRCINDLFSIRNVSSGCHLLVLSAWFPLGSTEVLAALPHLQKVMDLGQSAQFTFLCFSLQLYVVFSFSRIQYRIIACQ